MTTTSLSIALIEMLKIFAETADNNKTVIPLAIMSAKVLEQSDCKEFQFSCCLQFPFHLPRTIYTRSKEKRK